MNKKINVFKFIIFIILIAVCVLAKPVINLFSNKTVISVLECENFTFGVTDEYDYPNVYSVLYDPQDSSTLEGRRLFVMAKELEANVISRNEDTTSLGWYCDSVIKSGEQCVLQFEVTASESTQMEITIGNKHVSVDVSTGRTLYVIKLKK